MRLTFTNCMRGLLLLVPLFLCTILLANDAQHGEKITLSEKAVPLKVVFKKITSQTGIKFVYSNRLIDDEQKVNVSVKDADLEEVMEQIFLGRKFELQRTSPKSVVLIVHEKVVSSSAVPTNDVAVIDVSGTVSDVSGEKLPGATVQVRGMNKATMTDGEGRFRLVGVLANARVMVSYTGYQAEEIRLQGEREVNVKLQRGENQLDEAVVVAYGTTTQRSNTSAITVIQGEQIQALPNRSFDKSLQGLVPGLLITNGTGQPGGGVSNFVLRGISTGTDAFFGSTVRNPLIVIDGVPVTQDHFQMSQSISTSSTAISNPIAQLNPSDIASISVLKDAAAIALYGSKASNGVILITTKSGKPGKTVFTFRHQTDIAEQLKGKIESLNRTEYLELVYEAYRNTNATLWTDAAIRKDLFSKFPYMVSGNDTSFYPESNWNKELFNKNAITVSNELSMSGGNERSNFYLNFEYTKQNGVVKPTSFDRKSLRFNFENRPSSFLKIGINTVMSYTVQDYTNPLEDVISSSLAPVISPLNPIRDNNGNFIMNYSWGSVQSSAQQIANPVAVAEYNINKNTAYRSLSKLYGEVKALKYITLRSILGVDVMLAETKEKYDPRLRSSSGTLGGLIRERDVRRNNIINTNTLSFDKAFNNIHNLSIIIGQEAQIIQQRNLGGEARGTAATLPYYEELSSPGYPTLSTSGNSQKQTLLSQFASLNYGFNHKYLLSASGRRDASSKFGEHQQWGNYWSVGGGYVLSEESFMESLSPIVKFLKVRGSIGLAGSSGALNNSTRYDLLSIRKFQGNVALVPAMLSSGITGNPNIKWEQTLSWDAGLEGRFLNNRIGLTADIYNKKTSNLIYSMPLPYTTGALTVPTNIGDLKNYGIEVALSADLIKNDKISWNISANWSTNRNKLTKANIPLTLVTGGILANEEGRSFNSFFLPQWLGVNPADGKPLWIDSTGKPTSNYNAAGKKFVGNPMPEGFGTLTTTIGYKTFQFSAQFYYQYNYKLYDYSQSYSMLNDGTLPYVNQVKSALDRWKKAGDIATNPIRKLNNTDGGNRVSTRYLFDADYIRLQNITLTYGFPSMALRSIGLSSCKLMAQAHNLAIWTKFPGRDPDNANVGGGVSQSYPNQRSYSIGLTAAF